MSFEETVRLIVREELQALERRLATAMQSKQNSNADERLTLAQAASLAGASVTTMKKWISTGALEVDRHGRLVRVRRGDVEALLARHRVHGGELDADEIADQILGRGRQ